MDTQKNNYKVVLVGVGNMGRTHCRHWRSIPEANVTAIVAHDHDITLEGSENVSTYDTLAQALVDQPDIDIVDICVPTDSHLSVGLTAIDFGKHVVLEKPMARTLDECDQLIEAASRSNSTVMVAHVLRFFPEYALAHEQVQSGAVGIPAAIRTARLAGHPQGGWRDWYSDHAKSGGVILDMIIHDFDWLLWTFGPVDRVYAKGFSQNAELHGKLDYALVTLHHKSGALSHVTGSWAHTGGFRTTFEICGDSGMLEHDSALSAPLSIALRADAFSGAVGVAVPQSPMDETDDPYFKELTHFMDCITTGTPPSITLEDARAAVAVATAALESIKTGQPVTL